MQVLTDSKQTKGSREHQLLAECGLQGVQRQYFIAADTAAQQRQRPQQDQAAADSNATDALALDTIAYAAVCCARMVRFAVYACCGCYGYMGSCGVLWGSCCGGAGRVSDLDYLDFQKVLMLILWFWRRFGFDSHPRAPSRRLRRSGNRNSRLVEGRSQIKGARVQAFHPWEIVPEGGEAEGQSLRIRTGTGEGTLLLEPFPKGSSFELDRGVQEAVVPRRHLGESRRMTSNGSGAASNGFQRTLVAPKVSSNCSRSSTRLCAVYAGDHSAISQTVSLLHTAVHCCSFFFPSRAGSGLL